MPTLPAFVPAPTSSAAIRLPRRRARTPWACCDSSPPPRPSISTTVTTSDGATLHLTRHAAVLPGGSEGKKQGDGKNGGRRNSDGTGSAAELPPALLIHDFMTDRRLFSRLARTPELQSRELVALDLRGFGASSIPEGLYSRTEDILSVAGETRPHIVGVGLGGAVALELCLTAPERVRSVSVVGSGLPGHGWSSDSLYLDISAARRAGRLLMAGAATAGSEADRDVVSWKQRFIGVNRTWGDLLANNDRRAVARDAVAMARDYSGFHFFAAEQLDPDPFAGEPLRTRVEALRVPACIMVGELDTPDFRAIATEIFSAVKDAGDGVIEVPSAGHFAVMEEPQFVAQRLREFWGSVEQRDD